MVAIVFILVVVQDNVTPQDNLTHTSVEMLVSVRLVEHTMLTLDRVLDYVRLVIVM